uniref:Large ribosomal subunit protein bL35c n=1 Tax=Dasyclonium flaccidum TaxID=2007274 RepID=A0A1Z1MLL9_9FLOR|nr:ribosomal protein L35 [Dasyclonium flaccidum]ARW66644.1 ribosomal protein L35 [Dasyclonium flaccidum]
MYKLKTVRSINKRFRITSKGKLLKHKSCKNHLLQKKNSKRKRNLRIITNVKSCDKSNLKNGLPYLLN